MCAITFKKDSKLCFLIMGLYLTQENADVTVSNANCNKLRQSENLEGY